MVTSAKKSVGQDINNMDRDIVKETAKKSADRLS